VIGMALLNRRHFIGALAIGTSAQAQQRIGPRPREKGPKVFLDYDQAELDAAYSQAAYAPNQQQVAQRSAANSALVRERLGQPLRFSYGMSEIEQLDLYSTGLGRSPIQIFFHGGAWRGGSAKGSAYLAELFVTAGAHYIAPDFVAVQNADGSLMAMADQVRRAIAWVYRNALSFGGDPERIYVSGHSSGAHLAGVALTSDWVKDFNLANNVIKGAVLVSGMYDLRGPRLSSRSSYVKFDDGTEQALSPQRHIEAISAPLVVGYGSFESPEFQRQSREFAMAMRTAGKRVELIRGEGYNHFEFIETLANPYSPLGRAALVQMGLT
jgi:arylformamidase